MKDKVQTELLVSVTVITDNHLSKTSTSRLIMFSFSVFIYDARYGMDVAGKRQG